MKRLPLSLITLFISVCLSTSLHAEETNLEKAETVKNEVVDKAKSQGRKLQEDVCEMTNGKMVCMKRKLVNKTKNMMDKVGTKTTETINKVD